MLVITLTRPNISDSKITSKLSLTWVTFLEAKKHRRASFSCFSYVQKGFCYPKITINILSTSELFLKLKRKNQKGFMVFIEIYHPFQQISIFPKLVL